MQKFTLAELQTAKAAIRQQRKELIKAKADPSIIRDFELSEDHYRKLINARRMEDALADR